MNTSLAQTKIEKALDLAYVKAVDGIPGLDSATELDAFYAKKEGTLVENVNSLIPW